MAAAKKPPRHSFLNIPITDFTDRYSYAGDMIFSYRPDYRSLEDHTRNRASTPACIARLVGGGSM
jgi:hypothetical protein